MQGKDKAEICYFNCRTAVPYPNNLITLSSPVPVLFGCSSLPLKYRKLISGSKWPQTCQKKALYNSSFDCSLLLSLLFCITPHGVFMDCKSLKIIRKPVPFESSLSFFPSLLCTCINTQLMSDPFVISQDLKLFTLKTRFFVFCKEGDLVNE